MGMCQKHNSTLVPKREPRPHLFRKVQKLQTTAKRCTFEPETNHAICLVI